MSFNIEDPSYPDGSGGTQSCEDFLERIMTDMSFTGYDDTFSGVRGVTDARSTFKEFVCKSKAKKQQILERVRDIIVRLLDRTLVIPSLIHTNNMLWRRGELLRQTVEHYGKLSNKLSGEQVLLLKMLTHQAGQIHELMRQLGLEYDATTGKVRDFDGTDVDPSTVADDQIFLMAQPKFKQLVEVLSSAFSGSMFGQKLAVQSYPRIVLTFPTPFVESDAAAIQSEFAEALAAAVGEVLASDPLSSVSAPAAAQLAPLVQVMDGSTVIVFRMKGTDDDTKSVLDAMGGSADDSLARATIQRALVTLAFKRPDELTGKLAALWQDTPALQIPVTTERTAGEATEELKTAFGIDLAQAFGDLSSLNTGTGGGAPEQSEGTSQGSDDDVQNVEVKADTPEEIKAVLEAMWQQVQPSGLTKKQMMDKLCTAECRVAGVVVDEDGELDIFQDARETPAQYYHGEFVLDMEGLKRMAEAQGKTLPALDLLSLLAKYDAKPAADGPSGPKAPDVDVAGGAADAAAALKAEANSKAEQLAQIKALMASNDVKEFIRVRPYGDKDERATELQLQAVDKAYTRSADPADALGQLVTKVEYKGSCMNFTGVFSKMDPSDKFHDTFQAFIPKNKMPPKSEWFATVNGGIFPEFISYRERGVQVVPTDFLKVRKFLDFKPTYAWSKHPSEDREWVQPTQSQAELVSMVQQELAQKKQFRDLFGKWKGETSRTRGELETLIKTPGFDAAKVARFTEKLGTLPKPTQDDFIAEYLKIRVASDAINKEFVDTVWPVLSVFFGPDGVDGKPLYDETKNVVAFFYGASGSGKTFTAEALLDKVFETIKDHPDEFVLKLASDYNNSMFDYFSTGGNLKMVHNYELQHPAQKAFNHNPERALRNQQFEEMAMRAKYLTFDCTKDGSSKARVNLSQDFFEGNVSRANCSKKAAFPIARSADKRITLDRLHTFNPDYVGTWSQASEGHQQTSLTKKGYEEPGPQQKKYKAPKGDATIPKDPKQFAQFKKDFERRVREFRSVTDTGLNPESSRSHLLYLIQRKTKNGGTQPMDPFEKGALFVLADFAGTEDLNYLMNDDAWAAWGDWKDNAKHGGKGNCKVAGKPVKHDWACLDLAALTNASADGQGGKLKGRLRKALFEGWRNIKIKTLVASSIADMPTVPTDPAELERIKAKLREQWLSNLSKPYVTSGAMDKNGTKLDTSNPEEASRGAYVYFTSEEANASTDPLLAALPRSSTGKFSLKLATEQGLVEKNPHRFAVKNDENEDIVVNMVLAMHAESRHINDSLKEIADLVSAQREATKTDPTAKADVAKMEKDGVLTKTMVTDLLAPAVTAGSTAVTFGAVNPRRANDFDTWGTLNSITQMRGSCE